MTTAIAPANAGSTQTGVKLGDFGQGRYSALMDESFKQAQAMFALTPEAADKLARQIGSDYGAAFRNVVVSTKSKVVGKDNKLTLREAAAVKGITGTNALNVMHAMNWASDAQKNGYSFKGTSWKLVDALRDYLADL